MGKWLPRALALSIICLFSHQAKADVLEQPKETEIIESDMIRIESGFLGDYLYASYRITKLKDTTEMIRGDYYCFTNSQSSNEEILSVVHSLAGAAFLIAMKDPHARIMMSKDILRGRCFAPSKQHPMSIKLTGLVFQIVHTTKGRDQWELAILEGIAEIEGREQLVYVGKTRKLPALVS